MVSKSRDEFSESTKTILAKRIGLRCSKPDCGKSCFGPHSDDRKAISIGQAAHITSASKGGPRFNERLIQAERRSPDIGIWLCSIHARLIDSDGTTFAEEMLREWKQDAENRALDELMTENYALRKELEFVVSAMEGKDTYPSLEFIWCYDRSGWHWVLVLKNTKRRPLYDVVVGFLTLMTYG